jgi:hypothetical protein
MSRVTRVFPVFVVGIGLLVLVLAACSGSGGEGGEEASQAPPEEWRLVEEARIGSVDDPEDALSQVGTLLPLPGGGAWFIENADRQIRVVGREGRLSGRVGRPGQGPGEFTIPAGLGWWKGSTDTIWVGDRASRRISLFSLDGTFLESHPMPTVEWNGQWVVAHPGVVGPEGVGIGLASGGGTGRDLERADRGLQEVRDTREPDDSGRGGGGVRDRHDSPSSPAPRNFGKG